MCLEHLCKSCDRAGVNIYYGYINDSWEQGLIFQWVWEECLLTFSWFSCLQDCLSSFKQSSGEDSFLTFYFLILSYFKISSSSLLWHLNQTETSPSQMNCSDFSPELLTLWITLCACGSRPSISFPGADRHATFSTACQETLYKMSLNQHQHPHSVEGQMHPGRRAARWVVAAGTKVLSGAQPHLPSSQGGQGLLGQPSHTWGR